MALFGAPVAHGNDPERAARAALAIRDAMPDLSREFGRELNVHIGIASGQVVASGGAGYKTYSITGNSVNLASRLTDQAASGEILISDGVRRLLPERFVLSEARALEVKGLSEPVAAWRLSRGARPGGAARPGVRRPTHRARAVRGRAAGLPGCWLRAGGLPARRGRHRQVPPARGVPAPGGGAGFRLPHRSGARLRHGDRAGRGSGAGAQPARPARRQRPGC